MSIHKEKIDSSSLKITKPKKTKKPKEARDIRSVFRKHLSSLDLEKLKKPWMATKSFRVIWNMEELEEWVESVLSDASRHHKVYPGQPPTPVVAVDTENTGLDTRILYDFTQLPDGTWETHYYTNVEIAGVCLSADGIEGIYVPINHEDGCNISRENARRILQRLFDNSHLVFYNAKYDREILRITLGIEFRGYPHFEDVQVLQYILDPKEDVGDKGRGTFTGDAGGLKALSETRLGIEQIHGETLQRVKAEKLNTETGKTTLVFQYAPFTWIPTNIAVWYAAADAICTWLLWELMHEEAIQRKFVHHLDHELVESLTWLERQRFQIDTAGHARMVKWHQNKLQELRTELCQLAKEAGWVEEQDDEGNPLESTVFSPDSNPKKAKLLFEVMKLDVVKATKTGAASVDAEALADLQKRYPDNIFLKKLQGYQDYVALHPEKLRYDPRDNSARIYLKQNVVAGGRLSGAGGDFEKDGGFGLNPQGIVRVEGNWWVRGNVLIPDAIPEEEIEEHEEAELHPSCFKTVEIEVDGIKQKVKQKAPRIIKNHIGQYLGYCICLVPGCKTCEHKHGILIPKSRLDANEVINLRSLFIAPPGWTFFTLDFSNVEMRVAANVSGEPEFIKEFLEGSGDFHSLTASKVFPEFNDPKLDKALKKALRSLAKIINFALLYGGTAFTIFENMKKQKPDITWEEAKRMVDKYWEGVPVFAGWCQNKQHIARNLLTCSTVTGRVINFDSAMKALHIHKPSEIEMKNYWDYRGYLKKANQAKESGDKERESKYRAQADILWRNPDTGVRNAGDYNQFLGKVERVSVNVPLQGPAGDFMRITLNRLCRWVTKEEPGVQSVFRLPGSVHDEIDFCVKNEYVPFVIPRVSRLMKLRKYHAKMGWTVPLECDCEYGKSWDVEHHLTGDDGHKPAGWSGVPGMEDYIPAEFDQDTIRNLLKALASGEERRIAKARNWLVSNLHSRTKDAVANIFSSEGKPSGDKSVIQQQLLIALQLHEYWTTDEVPDDEKLPTLEEYEAANGLTLNDRGFAPPIGYLGSIPQDRVTRPEIRKLGEEAQLPLPSSTEENNLDIPSKDVSLEQPEEKLSEKVVADATIDTVTEENSTKTDVVDMIAEVNLPRLRPLTLEEAKRFRLAMGIGTRNVEVRYENRKMVIRDVKLTTIPEEFLIVN